MVAGEKAGTRGIEWDQRPEGSESTPFAEILKRGKWDLLLVKNLVNAAFAVFLLLYILINTIYGFGDPWIVLSTALSIGCIYTFINNPLSRYGHNSITKAVYISIDAALTLVTIAYQIYIYDNYLSISMQLSYPSQIFYILSGAMIATILEATRRWYGLIVILVPIFFMVHALFARSFPSFLSAPGTSVSQLIEVTINIDTLYGSALYVVIGTLSLFLLFGVILVQSGVSGFFISLASSLTGHRIGGPAKIAVVGSGILSAINGSAIANVASTGPITIGMMKNGGFSKEMAAGIEATASNGGHITPPVMGLVAFLIAGMIGMSYGELISRSYIPAILYFLAIYVSVHLYARAKHLPVLSKSDMPSFSAVLKEGWYFFLPLIAIVVTLMLDFSVTYAGLIGIVSALLVTYLHPRTRLDAVAIMKIIDRFMESLGPLIVACGMIGILLAALFSSGLATMFSSKVNALSEGNLLISLFSAAIAAMVLGFGMPVIAVYIILATLLVPALISVGSLEPLQAHLFVFYFASAAGVTPPVGIVSFTAAKIASSKPMLTAVMASMVGFGKYLIPFVFIFRPELLLYGEPAGIVWTIFVAVLIVILVSAGTQGFLFYRLSILGRAVAILSALLLVFGAPTLTTAGLGLIVVLGVLQLIEGKLKGATT